jgi:hypothetical protein
MRPIIDIATMPTPDHTARAMPSGMVSSDSDISEKAMT